MASTYTGPQDALEAYESVVDQNPAIERKGATMPYTARNGHMFSFLDKTGSMAIRLPDEQRNGFISEYETALAEQHGSVMQEFAVVPPELLRTPAELAPWLDLSFEWIGTLKPKPTRRRR